MRDAWLDLLLGSACVGCGRPGRLLCERCRAALPMSAGLVWPTPSPPGLAPPIAVGEYDELLKVLVNAHKERRHFALARALGVLLAHAVEGHASAAPSARWVLVPVPSRSAVVRERGHDPMLRVTRRAAVLLRRRGLPVSVAPMLRVVAPTLDQSGLGAGERAANLAGTMRCRPGRDRRPSTRYLVADDVITTGATAREAQRALEASGLHVAGIAAVAATRKLLAGPARGSISAGRLPLSGGDD